MHIIVEKTTETLMKTYQKVDVSCLGTKTKGKKQNDDMRITKKHGETRIQTTCQTCIHATEILQG